MQIQIQENVTQDKLSHEEIFELLKLVLTKEGFSSEIQQKIEISLMFCSEEEIHQLNSNYRGKDKATDVLSFAQFEDEFDELYEHAQDFEELILGDIVIAPTYAYRQAQEFGNSPEDELRLLLVHGCLHLLGYDHIQDEEAEKMEERERSILSSCPQWKGLR